MEENSTYTIGHNWIQCLYYNISASIIIFTVGLTGSFSCMHENNVKTRQNKCKTIIYLVSLTSHTPPSFRYQSQNHLFISCAKNLDDKPDTFLRLVELQG